MTIIAYIKAIATATALIKEGMSALRMLRKTVQDAKDLEHAGKETLLKEIEDSNKLVEGLKYPEDEI